MTAWRTAATSVERGDGDGFFDEGLLDADAHVAKHELEEVLGFDGGGAAEEGFDGGGADGGGFGGGHLGEGFGDFGSEGEFPRGVRVWRRGGQRRAAPEVAVAAVGGGEGGVGGGGDGEDGAGEEGSSGVELAGVGFGKGGGRRGIGRRGLRPGYPGSRGGSGRWLRRWRRAS